MDAIGHHTFKHLNIVYGVGPLLTDCSKTSINAKLLVSLFYLVIAPDNPDVLSTCYTACLLPFLDRRGAKRPVFFFEVVDCIVPAHRTCFFVGL